MKLIKLLTLSCLTLTVTGHLFCAEEETLALKVWKPLYFKVAKGPHAFYLLGTQHNVPLDLFSTAVKDHLLSAKVIVTEITPSTEDADASAVARAPSTYNLWEKLNSQEQQQMRLWFQIDTRISDEELFNLIYGYICSKGVDRALMSYAGENSLLHAPLETEPDRERSGVYTTIRESLTSSEVLEETVSYFKEGLTRCSSAQAFLDYLAYNPLLADKTQRYCLGEVENALVEDISLTSSTVHRNHAWMPKILEHFDTHVIQQQTHMLIAVGCAHLWSDEGLLALLQNKGFRITQYDPSCDLFTKALNPFCTASDIKDPRYFQTKKERFFQHLFQIKSEAIRLRQGEINETDASHLKLIEADQQISQLEARLKDAQSIMGRVGRDRRRKLGDLIQPHKAKKQEIERLLAIKPKIGKQLPNGVAIDDNDLIHLETIKEKCLKNKQVFRMSDYLIGRVSKYHGIYYLGSSSLINIESLLQVLLEDKKRPLDQKKCILLDIIGNYSTDDFEYALSTKKLSPERLIAQRVLCDKLMRLLDEHKTSLVYYAKERPDIISATTYLERCKKLSVHNQGQIFFVPFGKLLRQLAPLVVAPDELETVNDYASKWCLLEYDACIAEFDVKHDAKTFVRLITEGFGLKTKELRPPSQPSHYVFSK